MNNARYFKSLSQSPKWGLWIGLLILLAWVFVAFGWRSQDDFELAKQNVLLRKVGHEILLLAGDSTSRVLPVVRLSVNEYQIKFENEFTFQPDSLVSAIKGVLADEEIGGNYIVNVLNCSGSEIVFGYAILSDQQQDIVPCTGREQDRDCYIVNIKFQNGGLNALHKSYLIGGLPFLAFIGLMISKSSKYRKEENVLVAEKEVFVLGNTKFYAKQREILFEGSILSLTSTENKLLLIFANSPNNIIERSRLQKEIWEDEGVIVGRSLDVFISKLRKKLDRDQSVRLVNIHGKGYKLEI